LEFPFWGNAGHGIQPRPNHCQLQSRFAKVLQLVHAAPDCGCVEDRTWRSAFDPEEIKIVRRLNRIEFVVAEHFSDIERALKVV
jgi:hypothetical protein